MRFTSTRNKARTVGFAEAVLHCMPNDGGLYVPCDTEDLRRWILYTDKTTSFASIAGTLTSAFIKDEFSPIICETIATKAFPFEPAVRRLDDTHFMLELFHGPSGCHRDFGIAYLTACLETILQMRDSSATILAVTRRETGAVLAQELRGKKRIKAVVVCPKGNVYGMEESDYCWNGGNMYPVEIDGTEDDCRNLVRGIFSDRDFSEAHRLTVANTANIGRLLPQAFFYPFAFSRLKGEVPGDMYYALAPGNYSNIVAGLYSWRFALPLNGFFIPATDALTVNALRLAARQVERGSVLVPDDHVGSDGRDLQVVGGAHARQGCGLGVRQRTALQQRGHAPSLGGHRVDVALRVHGRDRAGQVRNTGVRIVRVDGRGVVRLLRPHLAVGRVRDRDRAAAHVRGHSPVVDCRRQGCGLDIDGSQRVGHLIGELDLLAVLEDIEG